MSISIKFLVICFKVINLRMRTSLRPDIKLQCLNLTPKDGPFYSLGTEIVSGEQKGSVDPRGKNALVKYISMTGEISALILVSSDFII